MRPIVDDLTPPVQLDRDHWRGGERAAFTLVGYGDDECPSSPMAFGAIQRLAPPGPDQAHRASWTGRGLRD